MNPDRIEEHIARRRLPEPPASLDGRIDRLLTTGATETAANRNQLVVTIGAAVATCVCLAGVVVSIVVLVPDKHERLVGSPERSEQRSESIEVDIPILDFSASMTRRDPLLGAGTFVVVTSVNKEGEE